MPRHHRHDQLSPDKLVPTRPVPGVALEVQVAHMRELREAQNSVAAGYRQRDGLMQAWALSNTLSREDMAVATGLATSRVNQLIRGLTERDIQNRNAALAAQSARHTPGAKD